MNPLLALIPLVTLFLLPSVFIKLAAIICRARLRWLHCFVFGLVVVVLSIAGRATSLYIWSPPLWLSIPVAVAVYLYFGSWFLSSRGIGRDGQPIGKKEAIKMTLVYLGLLALLGLLGGFLLGLLSAARST